MTEATPRLFLSILEPQRGWRGVTGSLGAVVVMYAILLVALTVFERRKVAELPPPPERLSVMLLDAPEVSARRSAGLAGGEGDVLLGSAISGEETPEQAPGAAPAPQPKKGKHSPEDDPSPTAVPSPKPAEKEDLGKTAASDKPVDPMKSLTNKPAAADKPAQEDEREQERPTAETDAAEATAQPTAAASGRASSAVQGMGGVGTGTGAGKQGVGAGTGKGLTPGPVSGDTEVLNFSDGMKRPAIVEQVDPVFTKEARDAKVQGLILTKCVITTSGRLRDCNIIKGIPLMNQQVLQALKKWRYEPVIYQGKPVSVRYLIPIRLKAP